MFFLRDPASTDRSAESAQAPDQAIEEAAPRATVEVRICDLGQLFSSLDPSPFQERDLDDDAEDYIAG